MKILWQFLWKWRWLDIRRQLQEFYPIVGSIIEITYLSVKPIPTAAVAQVTINRRPIMMLSRLLGTLLLMSDRTFWALSSSSWQKPKQPIRYLHSFFYYWIDLFVPQFVFFVDKFDMTGCSGWKLKPWLTKLYSFLFLSCCSC